MHYKRISGGGSVTIPVSMRREIGLQKGDAMEVSLEDGKVIVSPYQLRCSFCETDEDVEKFSGKGICKSCAEKILKKMGG